MILKKLGDEYKLYSHDSCIATTYESPYKKLSLKNCQAIENGYDVIDLAERNSKYNEEDWGSGFLFAMNLMSDKKFSEEDVKKRVELVKQQFRKDVDAYGKPKKIMSTLDTIHQSLQQTEWDCTIVTLNDVPVLDADSCLILKRK